MKERKWFGFGHREEDPGPGELALFCPACPQPGINIPEDWRDQPDEYGSVSITVRVSNIWIRWKYTRGFVMDGNFTCYHRQQKRKQDDVWLKDGHGYMTGQDTYQKHITAAVEKREESTCHEHHAVNDKSKTKKGCDSTGLGATACLRHGCYCPTAIVDFQKGERQMNMDYSLSQSLANTGCQDIQTCIVVYDVMCQYYKHLRARVNSSSYLDIPANLQIIPGIGLFHVHGHQQQCYARFSPSFIQGAGNADGEILETLWSVLNDVGRTTSTMTLAHRSEVLDAHMGDSNWKKLIRMVPVLVQKLLKARTERSKFRKEFDTMNKTISSKRMKAWEALATICIRDRIEDPEVMDAYDVKVPNVKTRVQIQTELMNDEIRDTGRGMASWISAGLKIQEEQWVNCPLDVHILTYIQGRNWTVSSD
jgi:hypothetical protein